MKKLLLSLGSVAAVAAPIAAVVACGDSESVKTFGHTYGKQEATGFFVEVSKQGTVVEAGKYYLSADEAKAGKTFKVLKTKATNTNPAEYTTLTIVANIASGKSVGTNFKYDASGTATPLTNTTVNVAKGSTTAFYVKDGDKTKESLATSADLATSIKDLLNANKDEAVKYEAEDKKTDPAQSTKDIVSELLKDTGLEVNAITLNAAGTEISTLTIQAAGTTAATKRVDEVKKELEKMTIVYPQGKTIKAVSSPADITNAADVVTAVSSSTTDKVVVSKFPADLKDVKIQLKSTNATNKEVVLSVTSTKINTITEDVKLTATEAA